MLDAGILLSLLHDEHQRLRAAQEENAQLRAQLELLSAQLRAQAQHLGVPGTATNWPADDERAGLVAHMQHLKATARNGEAPAPEGT